MKRFMFVALLLAVSSTHATFALEGPEHGTGDAADGVRPRVPRPRACPAPRAELAVPRSASPSSPFATMPRSAAPRFGNSGLAGMGDRRAPATPSTTDGAPAEERGTPPEKGRDEPGGMRSVPLAIASTEGGNSIHNCGATVFKVEENHCLVLSAAHCFEDTKVDERKGALADVDPLGAHIGESAVRVKLGDNEWAEGRLFAWDSMARDAAVVVVPCARPPPTTPVADDAASVPPGSLVQFDKMMIGKGQFGKSGPHQAPAIAMPKMSVNGESLDNRVIQLQQHGPQTLTQGDSGSGAFRGGKLIGVASTISPDGIATYAAGESLRIADIVAKLPPTRWRPGGGGGANRGGTNRGGTAPVSYEGWPVAYY